MGQPVYEVVWPLGKSVYEIIPPADRSKDLSGKTVCELWDQIFRGDEMFPVIREALSKRYHGIKFVDHTNFGHISGPQQRKIVAALPQLLKKHGCDAVIAGVGA